jgi:hypothetical protein
MCLMHKYTGSNRTCFYYNFFHGYTYLIGGFGNVLFFSLSLLPSQSEVYILILPGFGLISHIVAEERGKKETFGV